MSKDFEIESEVRYGKQIAKLLSDCPAYFEDYYQFWKNKGRKNSSLYMTLRNIRSFLEFEQYMIPECNDLVLKDMPLFIFDKLTEDDIAKYWEQMKAVKLYNYDVRCKNIYSISNFYKFLNLTRRSRNNPLLFFEIPELTNSKSCVESIRQDDADRLIQGILENKNYLIHTDDGDAIVPIPYATWIKRERLVLRNQAICTLFLETDLRLSEVVGLDLSDLNFDNHYLIIPEKNASGTRHIPLSATLEASLKLYLGGSKLPDKFLDSYLFQDESIYQWCCDHIQSTKINNLIYISFPDKDEQFYRDVLELTALLRRHGRKGFKPSSGEKAVFLSLRGKRMTARMIEYMVKEMLQTYLPDGQDTELLSPERFRKVSLI